MTTTIAYGYGVTASDQKPSWVVHPNCRDQLKKHVTKSVLLSAYHGDTNIKSHPLYRAKCWVCENTF